MNYAQLLAGLMVIGCHVIFGGKEVKVSQGTHLTSLRESDKFRVSDSLQKSDKFVMPDALNLDNRSHYSYSKARSQLSLLHASEEYQVAAAWIQLTWVPKDKSLLGRMEKSERWRLRGERVKRIITMLAQATAVEKSIIELYELCYQKTDLKDRCVPGCGNNRQVLIRPELFARKTGFTYELFI